MSHAREPSSLKVKDARERGRSRAAAAIQPASPLLSLSLPPQARRRHKLVMLCHRRKLVFLLRPSTPPRRELVSGQVQCVGFLLKKILQVIELRVSHQAESLKNVKLTLYVHCLPSNCLSDWNYKNPACLLSLVQFLRE
ncbi:uncharacterized protein [Arachis hypogaea]|uniref:uncharacterized protein isoform X1 n=1 Tax=Arachis hypogaea TaxID=3818 RepID=UPI000DEC171C